MKNCPVCGTENKDADIFCKSCGASLDAPASGGWDNAVEAQSVQNAGKKSSRRDAFVDQSEEIISTIGSNYLQNFLSGGKVERGIGILTQKRFYYKGKNYSGTGKDMKSATEEGVVSMDDITFSRFVYTRPTGLLIAALLSFLVAAAIGVLAIIFYHDEWLLYVIPVPVIPSLLFLIRYFTSRQTLFLVSFPGGSFGFNVKYYPIADIRDFQRQLHLLKDRLREENRA